MLDITKINETIDNEYSADLQAELSHLSQSLQNDTITAQAQEKFIVGFTAIYLYHNSKEAKAATTTADESDLLYEGVDIANFILKNDYEIKIEQPMIDKFQKQVAALKKIYGIEPATKLDEIEDEKTRELLKKAVNKLQKMLEKDLAEKEKEITPYNITGNKTSAFKKKVDVYFDALSNRLQQQKMARAFGPTPAGKENIEAFERNVRELFTIYDIQNKEDSFKYFRHMFINIKRNINKMSVKNAQMYCFCGSGENTGKTSLCNSIYRVSSLQNNVESDDINSNIVENLNFGNIVSRFGNPEYYDYPIIHIDEKRIFQDNEEEILKNIITSPIVNIERKGKDVEKVENHSTIIVSLNDSADRIMHNNSKERRRAIIDFTDKDNSILRKMNSLELDKIIYNILVSTPTEYYYDVDEVNEAATERVQNDGILEEMVSNLDFITTAMAGQYLTANKWADTFSDGMKISPTFLRNYMSRHTEYFDKKTAKHGCIFFKPTEKLIQILKEDVEQEA